MANRKIEDVEGIGPTIGGKLRTAGIKDTDTLLAQCGSPSQRKAVADKSGLTGAQVLKFANMVDLYRINGVGSEYAELLEVAGVNTVPQLARRNANNLTTAMAAVNEQKKLTRRPPSATEVAKWVVQAQALPRVLTY